MKERGVALISHALLTSKSRGVTRYATLLDESVGSDARRVAIKGGAYK